MLRGESPMCKYAAFQIPSEMKNIAEAPVMAPNSDPKIIEKIGLLIDILIENFSQYICKQFQQIF